MGGSCHGGSHRIGRSIDYGRKHGICYTKEFRAPESEVAELTLGAERAVFEKPAEVGKHMKPLYMKGNMDGKPMGWMMVDGGVSINIMMLDMFRKLGA
jgi:hypothetical protein